MQDGLKKPRVHSKWGTWIMTKLSCYRMPFWCTCVVFMHATLTNRCRRTVLEWHWVYTIALSVLASYIGTSSGLLHFVHFGILYAWADMLYFTVSFLEKSKQKNKMGSGNPWEILVKERRWLLNFIQNRCSLMTDHYLEIGRMWKLTNGRTETENPISHPMIFFFLLASVGAVLHPPQ